MASYREYKKGLWEYRINYKDPLTGKQKEKSKRGFISKKEARLAAEIVENDIRDGFKEENILLKDYIHYWLESHKKPNIRRSTYENKESQIKVHILPFFQNIRLDQVKPIFYQTFIDHMAEQGYSRSTIENNHSILKEMFNKAVEEQKIKKNPALTATVKGAKKEEESLLFIPSNEINALLQNAFIYGWEYYIFLKTLVETGLRKGEAAALQWDDINFHNNTITVWRSFDFKYAEFAKTTKTYHSKRTIPVASRLIQELKKHRQRQNENKLALGDKYNYDMNLVFCRSNGDFMPKSSLFNAFRRIQTKAGIFAGHDDEKNQPIFYSIHSLRHTHAVICLENKMDMKTLQDRLGHGSFEITMNVYAHVSNKMQTETIKQYEEGTNNIFNVTAVEGVFN